jgi:hypothetical protein
MSQKITATHERVDDIPAIIAYLKKMRVAELLDNHFPTNDNWQGLRLGWTTVVWLTFILSEGDHRLARVEPWVTPHRRTLSRCLGHQGNPRDLILLCWRFAEASLSGHLGLAWSRCCVPRAVLCSQQRDEKVWYRDEYQSAGAAAWKGNRMEQLTSVYIDIQLLTTAQTKAMRGTFTDPKGATEYLRRLADEIEQMHRESQ